MVFVVQALTGFLIEETAIIQIVDQCSECCIGRWQQLILGPFQVWGIWWNAVRVVTLTPYRVVVPDEVDLDQTNACFDQTPGGERGLPESVPAVSFPRLICFVTYVKRLSHCW